LERIETSKSPSVRRSYLWLCDTALQWLLLQYSLFRIAEASVSDRRWTALNHFVSFYTKKLSLGVAPLPLFGYSYFSSGSFSYYKRLSFRLEKEYYVVSVDKSDPPLFWSLAVHEFFHCWLGMREDIDRICSSQSIGTGRIDRTITERRVEEALCDALATRIIGPAYPHSYLHKLWAQFPVSVDVTYPTHRFRIECMAKVLDGLKLFESAKNVRDIGDAKFSDSWQDEEISWAMNEIVAVASKLPRFVKEDVESEAKKEIKSLDVSPPKDLPTLLLACWMFIESPGHEGAPSAVSRASDVILKVLEG